MDHPFADANEKWWKIHKETPLEFLENRDSMNAYPKAESDLAYGIQSMQQRISPDSYGVSMRMRSNVSNKVSSIRERIKKAIDMARRNSSMSGVSPRLYNQQLQARQQQPQYKDDSSFNGGAIDVEPYDPMMLLRQLRLPNQYQAYR